jgi:hypothetical protein
LIEHALADDEMRKRGAHLGAIDLVRDRGAERFHVLAVLLERNGRAADVVALLEKQHRAGAADVGDPVVIRRSAQRTAGDLDLVLLLDARDHRFEREERQAKAP